LREVQQFDLQLMSFDVAPTYALYTNQGIPVKVKASTQLKVENDVEKIKRAANQFLSKTGEERDAIVRQVIEGTLRGVIGQLSIEQLVKDPELVAARMRETVAADLDKTGLELVSFTLRDIAEEAGYIRNLSRPEIARTRQAAEIAEVEAERNVAIRQAETLREAAQARARADQDRVLAEAVSRTAQAEARRDLEIKEAGFAATVAAEKARADRAYDIEAAIAEQRQVEELAKVAMIQKQQEIALRRLEADWQAADQNATRQRDADAESARIRLLAEAERRRAALAAEADAEAIRLRGEAEACAAQARGEAEAEALARRVAALNTQTQVALVDTAIHHLPEVARSLAEAYGRIGSVIYLDAGEGEGVTARVARDVSGMVPLLGEVVEAVTGLNLHDTLAGANGSTAGSPRDLSPLGPSVKKEDGAPWTGNRADATPAPGGTLAG
jgi:flotillin